MPELPGRVPSCCDDPPSEADLLALRPGVTYVHKCGARFTGRGTSRPEHHGQPMRWRGAGHTWEGEFEVTEERYDCFACRTEVTVTTREHVGPVPS